ncbi:MAG: FAD-dependent monooxygenase [Burkholderiaceae bacterium]|nr:FAD-dependent monooxygenase [Burkholderiaceae bacterium]
MTAAAPLLIVGGGPVGLALALMLSRRAVRSIVVDARTIEQAQADRRLLALSRGTLQLLAPSAPTTSVPNRSEPPSATATCWGRWRAPATAMRTSKCGGPAG